MSGAFPFAMSLQELVLAIGLIAGAVTGLGVIWKRGVKPVLRFIRATVHAADALDETLPVLREIAEEFKPNHGTSLKDVVERLDRNVHTNAENVATVYWMVSSRPDVDLSMVAPLKPLEDTPLREEAD